MEQVKSTDNKTDPYGFCPQCYSHAIPLRLPRRKVSACIITILVTWSLVYYLWLSVSAVSRELGPIHTQSQPVWFIGTLSAAQFASRRNLIRSTWQALYNRPILTLRFVLGRVQPEFTAAIEAENATYGDLISLPWVEENDVIANTIKPLEFFSYLVASGRYHPFVSKLDDDSFLNLPPFWDQYLVPRLNSSSIDPVIIARPVPWLAGKDDWPADFTYPGGQFYTLSWDLVEAVVETYSETSNRTLSEDLFMGKLLLNVRVNYTFVSLSNREAFDYAPLVKDTNGWGHGIAEGAINPHRLKTDQQYMEVARLFDHEGLHLGLSTGSES